MTKSTHRTLPLKDIKQNYFVRKGINQDHVLMLAELYEASLQEHKGEANPDVLASQAVTPIQVTGEGDLIDGRHRKEAMELVGIKEARVEVLEVRNPSDLVILATKANYGGALPPTRDDMIYTVDQLLHRFGMTQKSVEEKLSMLPKGVVRKYINHANRRYQDAQTKLALADMATGTVTLKAAALKHGVPEAKLKEVMAGKKPKPQGGSAQTNSILATQFKAFGNVVGRIMNRLLVDYHQGEIAEEQAQQVINHFEHLLRRVMLRANDWHNRLRAIKTGATEAVPVLGGTLAQDRDIADVIRTRKEPAR